MFRLNPVEDITEVGGDVQFTANVQEYVENAWVDVEGKTATLTWPLNAPGTRPTSLVQVASVLQEGSTTIVPPSIITLDVTDVDELRIGSAVLIGMVDRYGRPISANGVGYRSRISTIDTSTLSSIVTLYTIPVYTSTDTIVAGAAALLEGYRWVAGIVDGLNQVVQPWDYIEYKDGYTRIMFPSSFSGAVTFLIGPAYLAHIETTVRGNVVLPVETPAYIVGVNAHMASTPSYRAKDGITYVIRNDVVGLRVPDIEILMTSWGFVTSRKVGIPSGTITTLLEPVPFDTVVAVQPHAATHEALGTDPLAKSTAIDTLTGFVDNGNVRGEVTIDANAGKFQKITPTDVQATLDVESAAAGSELVFTAVPLGAAGNAITVEFIKPDLNNQAISASVNGDDITVNLATNNTGVASSAVIGAGDNGQVTITSDACGEAGDELTITTLFGDQEDGALSAAINDGAITVTLGMDKGDAALAAIGSGDNGTVVVTAATAGADGNDLSIEVVLGAINGAMSAAIVGDVITVTLGMNGGTSATANIGGTENSGVTATIDATGEAGNAYTFEAVEGQGNNVPMSAALNVNALVVTLGTDENGAIDATKNTATLIAAAIDNIEGISAIAHGNGTGIWTNAAASRPFTGGINFAPDAAKNTATLIAAAIDLLAEVTAVASGTGASSITAIEGPTQFTGGGENLAASAAKNTATLIAAAVANLAGVTATASGNGSGTILTEVGPIAFEGGVETVATSTAANIITLIEGTPAAAALVAIANADDSDGSGVVDPFHASALSGGLDGDITDLIVTDHDPNEQILLLIDDTAGHAIALASWTVIGILPQTGLVALDLITDGNISVAVVK